MFTTVKWCGLLVLLPRPPPKSRGTLVLCAGGIAYHDPSPVKTTRPCSSIGRARQWYGGGCRFESCQGFAF
jgi:hypothetical protein